MRKARRDFIKAAVATTAWSPFLPLLSGCSSLDRYFFGDSVEEGQRVVILGAGLAGLSAAYQLKKNQHPFLLLEGSARAGGRVMSLRSVNASERSGELGGERIEADHLAIQDLAKELRVSLGEFTPQQGLGWFEKGKLTPLAVWRQELVRLHQVFKTLSLEIYASGPQILNRQNCELYPKAVEMDRLSCSQLFEGLRPRLQPGTRLFLEQFVRSEWGVEPSQLSSLHFLHWMRDSFPFFEKKFFKITGGSEVFTQALYDRIAGVMPDRWVRLQHQLIAIRPNENGWKLIFQTPQGKVELVARKVICTLPPKILHHIDGWQDVRVSQEKKDFVQHQELATHGKALLSFRDRFWGGASLLGSGGRLITDLGTTSLSEAGDRVVENWGKIHGLLQVQLGGASGAQLGPQALPAMLKDLLKINPNSSTYEDIFYLQNWQEFPWSRGSRAYLKPGQFQLFDSRPSEDNFQLAGDAYQLSYLGTMNGAVLSGIEAAQKFLKTRA